MSENRDITLIDLIIIIWRKTKQGVANVFCLIAASLCLSVKYFWIVLPAIIVALAAGFFYSSHERTKYSAEGVITFFTENRLAIDNEIKTLNSLKGNDRDKFNQLFGITDEQNRQLLEIKALPVIDYLNDSIPDVVAPKHSGSIYTDTINTMVHHMMGIRFILRGTTDYKPYMDGLVAYFDNLPKLRNTDSVAKSMTAERIAFCQQEIERLERFSEYDYFGGGRVAVKTRYSDGITIEPSRKKLYYENMQELINQKDYLTSYLTGKERVINFISPYMNVLSIPRYIVLTLFLFIGFVLGATIAYFVDRRRQSK